MESRAVLGNGVRAAAPEMHEKVNVESDVVPTDKKRDENVGKRRQEEERYMDKPSDARMVKDGTSKKPDSLGNF